MTNSPLPDDELASALVDGLGDERDRARLASDPALAARVEQLRAVRQAVATSTAGAPPSAEARERAVAAALAAAVPQEIPARELPAQEMSAQAPLDLDARRNRRRAWVPAAAAAAVVAVLGLGAFAALRDRGADADSPITAAAEPPATTLAGAGDVQRESTFDAAGTTQAASGATTTAAAPSGQDSGEDTSGAGPSTTAAAPAAVGGAPAPTAAADGLPDLGSIDETEGLRTALAALPTVADGAGTEAAACATGPTGRLVARLIWVGQPALVVVVDDGPPSRAVVVTATGCHPLAEVTLP